MAATGAPRSDGRRRTGVAGRLRPGRPRWRAAPLAGAAPWAVASASRAPGARGVGVDEVEPGVGAEPGEQRRARRRPTVFQPMCGTTGARAGSTRPATAEPLGDHAVLVAVLEQDLHADADAEHRPAAGRPGPRSPGRRRARRTPAMHAAKAPTPGTTRPSALGGRGQVGGHRHVGADPLQRAFGRAQVARAVVEHDHPAMHILTPGQQPQHAAGRRRPRPSTASTDDGPAPAPAFHRDAPPTNSRPARAADRQYGAHVTARPWCSAPRRRRPRRAPRRAAPGPPP